MAYLHLGKLPKNYKHLGNGTYEITVTVYRTIDEENKTTTVDSIVDLFGRELPVTIPDLKNTKWKDVGIY